MQPLEEMPGVLPVNPALGPEEVARRQLALLEARVTGRAPHPDSLPEVQKLYFDIVARSADAEAVNGKPLTVQWRFRDAEPWHVVGQNGSTRAESGAAASGDRRLSFAAS